jgi:selenocysteine-specific elongation factor
MSHTVIGTAGHIDHGKTLIVKGLTGVDTDRAPQERARGITIELGFAFFGDEATIIDVPGHERFVKTMVAGVSTIDIGLFVIAADDGVMPQSREHLDILDLMGVTRGVIALNKVDLVEQDWLELVEEEIRDLVSGTGMEGAEIVRVCALTGAGIDALQDHLRRMIEETPAREDQGPFRLPVDRTFVVKGFGLVSTGTVLSGSLREGEMIEMLPACRQIRVRGIQRHGELVGAVQTGDRAAINLPGLEQSEVQRGDTLASPDFLQPTHMLDVSLRLLSSSARELAQRARVRLHIGTAEILARVVLLDREVLEKGDEALAQLRLESPVVAAWGDRFVIRRYSPPITIGGGQVLEPHPRKRKSADEALVSQKQSLKSGDLAVAVEAKLRLVADDFCSATELAGRCGRSVEEITETLRQLESTGQAVTREVEHQVNAVHSVHWDGLTDAVYAGLQAYHAENPLKQGLRRQELRSLTARYVRQELFDRVLDTLAASGRIALDGAVVRAGDHGIHFSPQEEELKKRIETELELATSAAMPDTSSLARQLGADEKGVASVLSALQSLGTVAALEGGLLAHRSLVDSVRQKLKAHLQIHGEVTVAAFRDLIGSNRKSAMAFLSLFDREGTTERQGDVRVLRD